VMAGVAEAYQTRVYDVATSLPARRLRADLAGWKIMRSFVKAIEKYQAVHDHQSASTSPVCQPCGVPRFRPTWMRLAGAGFATDQSDPPIAVKRAETLLPSEAAAAATAITIPAAITPYSMAVTPLRSTIRHASRE